MAGATQQTGQQKRFWERSRFRQGVTGWLFATPILFYFAIFMFGPILASFALTFYEWDGIGPLRLARFVGLGNVQELFVDPRFLGAYRNTILYTVIIVCTSVVLGLALALAINKISKAGGFVRAIYFLPVILPLTAMSLLWSIFYQPRYGLFNQLLQMVGLSPVPWLHSTETALFAVCLMIIWKELGWYMVILLAGLKSIPEEYYEAARIDGANAWQQLWKITLPLLKPTVLFVTIVSVINSLQVFSPIYLMTKGGPVNETNTVVYWMYRTAFYHMRFGYATTMTMALFAGILLVTLLQIRLFRDGGTTSHYR